MLRCSNTCYSIEILTRSARYFYDNFGNDTCFTDCYGVRRKLDVNT